MMRPLLTTAALTSLLLSGAIFGFFYAWVCSTMWGLDAADPRVAIAAMQAMNASVRNLVFAPAFFATPFVLLLTAGLAFAMQHRRAALLFALAGGVYLLGGAGLTMLMNVPMNEALAQLAVPEVEQEARDIWMAYSPEWQNYNIIRTVVSGLTLALSGMAILSLQNH